MKITVKTAVVCSILWIIVKVAYHLIWPETTELSPLIFSNMFLLISSISFGLYLHKKQEGFSQGNALSDIKAAMASGVPYALVVSLFMFFYYNNINTQFITNIKKPFIAELKSDLKDEKTIEKLKRLNPELETKNKDEIYQQGIDNINAQTNPKATAIISLLGMIVLSTLYSILITIVYRKVLVKGVN